MSVDRTRIRIAVEEQAAHRLDERCPLAAPFNSEAKLAVDRLGIPHDVSAEQAMRHLGWTPRTLRESILDTAESLISAGIVRPSKPVS